MQQHNRHRETVTTVVFSPGGQLLASASYDTIRLWNPATGEQVQQLAAHNFYINAVVFSPDGQLLASGSFMGTVGLWNVVTGEQMQHLDVHSDLVNAIAFSPDSQLLASASTDKAHPATGEQVEQLDGQSGLVNAVAFSPRINLLALSEDIFLDGEWVTQDGQRILRLPDDYRGACSASRGNLLALGQKSGVVSFLEFKTA